MNMNRQYALISAMLLGSAAAQSATTSTVIGEVTLTRPATVQSPTEEVQTLTTVEPITPPSSETAQAAQPEAPEEEVAAPAVTTAPAEVTEEAPEQVAEPVQPAESAAPVTAPVTPVTPPSSANPPIVVPAPKQTAPAATQQPAPAQAVPATPAPAQATPAQQTTQPAAPAPQAAPQPTATTSAGQSATAPSHLPTGWRHLSGEIAGSKSVVLPAGSKVQVAIEAVNRATGQHSTHLVVGFGTEMLGTTYNLNYNPARLNTAQYDYVVQAKVFDADGDMIYMSDTKQPLPADLAAKLKIDMNF